MGQSLTATSTGGRCGLSFSNFPPPRSIALSVSEDMRGSLIAMERIKHRLDSVYE